MTSQEIMWLAGLLEGEGCFSWTVHNTPVIKLKMTDPDVVERCKNLTKKGSLYIEKRREGWKTAYIWKVNGRDAAALMMTILSCMGIRRFTKIKEIIAMWKNHSSGRKRQQQPHRHGLSTFNNGL